MRVLELMLVGVVFLACWAGTSWALARVGGWARLAARYAQGGRPFVGERRRFARVRLGWLANYGRTLDAGRGPAGIRLALLPLLAVGHPPLLIPWDELLSAETKGIGPFRRVVLRFEAAPEVGVAVAPKLFAWLMAGRRERA